MKKVIPVFVLVFAFLFISSLTKAGVTELWEPVIMTEKIDNPIGDHGETPKSPTFFYIYQSGNVFYFGESYAGCHVSLVSNDVTVYGTVVDPHGFVVIPSPVTGSYEMEATVNDITYWAEIQL